MGEERLDYIVLPEDGGREVKALLRQRFGLSTGLLRRLKQTPGGILLGGVPVTVRAVAAPGQCLSILREPDTGRVCRVAPEDGALDIVYEDADLLILNKPAGLAVHPSPGHDGGTLGNRVAGYYRRQGLELLYHPINRLDRGTSGLLCVAKTQLAAQRLGAQLQRREIHRTYHALVAGGGLPAAGTIDLPIGRCPGKGISREVRPDGEHAVTHFCVLERRETATLLEIRLDTGRTHQIRVHFSFLGHPVLGDFMYGIEYDWLEGQALHSCALALNQPLTGQRLSFTVPDPWYFDRLRQAAGESAGAGQALSPAWEAPGGRLG